MEVWYGGGGFSCWFVAFVHVLYIAQDLPIIFPVISIYSEIAFLYYVPCTDISHKRRISSF